MGKYSKLKEIGILAVEGCWVGMQKLSAKTFSGEHNRLGQASILAEADSPLVCGLNDLVLNNILLRFLFLCYLPLKILLVVFSIPSFEFPPFYLLFIIYKFLLQNNIKEKYKLF